MTKKWVVAGQYPTCSSRTSPSGIIKLRNLACFSAFSMHSLCKWAVCASDRGVQAGLLDVLLRAAGCLRRVLFSVVSLPSPPYLSFFLFPTPFFSHPCCSLDFSLSSFDEGPCNKFCFSCGCAFWRGKNLVTLWKRWSNLGCLHCSWLQHCSCKPTIKPLNIKTTNHKNPQIINYKT